MHLFQQLRVKTQDLKNPIEHHETNTSLRNTMRDLLSIDILIKNAIGEYSIVE